jgi:hypothetical protein
VLFFKSTIVNKKLDLRKNKRREKIAEASLLRQSHDYQKSNRNLNSERED